MPDSPRQPVSLADVSHLTLARMLEDAGHKPVHAKAILRRYHQTAGRTDFAGIGGVGMRRWIGDTFVPVRSNVVARDVSSDGTTKLLLAMGGGSAVESVFMPDYRDGRAAVCVSSQVGCPIGCDFCASTRGGLERNLDAGEIVEQVIHLRRLANDASRQITSLVFMGIGEPMLNIDAVIESIRRLADPETGGIGWRQVTVSTVGIVPGIDTLADADLNVHLALSLHAADDETRTRLVPPNRRYDIDTILDAARRFYARTGRIVTIEYCLLDGVNDSPDHARSLADRLDGFRAHVNLIPYNPAGAGLGGTTYRRPSPERVDAFVNALRDRGVVAHIRRTRGTDRNAACGQLRAVHASGPRT